MTTYNKATLKTFFQTGDVPTGTDYANFIDSYVNLVETTEQTMAGPLNTTQLITPIVSCTNFNVTGNMTVDGVISANDLAISGSVSAAGGFTMAGDLIVGATGNFQDVLTTVSIITNGTLDITGDVSADASTVYASAIRSTNGIFCGVGIVSALGTTQAAAAPLTFSINRGKGVSDGSTTGYRTVANRTGLVQYLYNEGASANLWPPTGGTINGLAANAAFSIAASSMITIVHLTASAMAAK